MQSCQCSRIFLEPHEPHPCQRPLGTTYTHLEDAIIERNLKLVPAHRLGRLSDADTNKFAKDVRRATAPQRYQLTTDGFKPYIKAIATHLRDRVDYAQLKKSYATSHEGERRYSPPDVVEVVPRALVGNS